MENQLYNNFTKGLLIYGSPFYIGGDIISFLDKNGLHEIIHKMKKYSQSLIKVGSIGNPGILAPDGVTIKVDENGTIFSTGEIGYIVYPEFSIDFSTGHLSAIGGAGVEFYITENGHLESVVL